MVYFKDVQFCIRIQTNVFIHEIILNLEIMGHHKNIIEEHIQNFATAINSGDIHRILSFYSDDCLFMPSDFGTLTKAQIGKSSSAFFSNKDFKIQFDDVEIDINENHAFVESKAKTKETNVKNGTKLEKTSRDFFVFRKEGSDWKIFRYIFNNVKENNF